MKRINRKILDLIRNHSIFKKFILIFGITVVVPIFGISIISYHSQQQQIRHEIQQSVSVLTSNINASIQDWYSKMNIITSLLYSTNLLPILERGCGEESIDEYTQLQDNIEMNKVFQYLLSQNNDIQNIYLFTPRQHYFTTYNGFLKEGYQPELESWYQQVKEEKGNILLFNSKEDWPLFYKGQANLFMGREIHTIDNQFQGVLLIDVNVKSIQQLVNRFSNSYNTEFLIFDQWDNLIYQEGDTFTITTDGQMQVLEQISSSDELIYCALNDEKVLLTLSATQSSSFRVVGITAVSRINQQMESLYRMTTLLILGSIFLFTLFVILLYHSLIRPIYQLNNLTKQAAAKNFNIHADIHTRDEIGELCQNFNDMIIEINRLINSEYKLALLSKDAKFNALQAQINPHFLYNTLQLINSIAVVKKAPEISKVTLSLGYMLRFSIKSEGNLVAMAQELKHVESYIAIQKTRMEDDIQVITHIEPEAMACSIMKLTLQPFIENAFQHGVENIRDVGIIQLSVKTGKDNIHIEICDNGVGMDEESLHLLRTSLAQHDTAFNQESSIGIRNVNARLRLFYQDNYSLKIHSRKGEGTQVFLRIPIIPANTFFTEKQVI